ncbi:hypothetical protein AMAG_06595 [Allomyces macrogynus ATCC 38327]|uniref:Peptidase M16C associated domain-containing protein n=1 Tax=Allomyces macrogynus (strain ATCC 38327) TaxID=578462 RepID=A0A0L0SEH4_ALLM3|nr:hypothetical protein AMAG_06595 [Allomyces macrogynus ATCC 38327]|eukprot:KNE60829.1 hypothetical protein AMAG_06595 [Allomyces macrogynus ATCC 38327]
MSRSKRKGSGARNSSARSRSSAATTAATAPEPVTVANHDPVPRDAVPGFVEIHQFAFEIPGVRTHPVTVFEHRPSCLRVVHAQTDGPLCSGLVVVPTTVKSDNGLPHCLEHLLFTGSKTIPHRGFLDAAAMRALSTGTNAWTDSDCTCYNIVTAGSAGLATMLPIFLDHIFAPTLRPDQFTTEVYHIDGHGNEQGVVFCEMMAREHTEVDLVDLHVRRALYGPESTYAYECGGHTPQIRNLTNTVVRAYHGTHYHVHNATVAVVGGRADDAAHVLRALRDAPCLQTRPTGPRATITTPPHPLAAGVVSQTIEFPSEDEDVGSITYGWQGPDVSDSRTAVALEVLFRYLQESSSSPLHQAYVESDGAAANDLDFELRHAQRTMFTLALTGVEYYGPDDDDDESDEDEDDEFVSDSEEESDDDASETDGDDEEGALTNWFTGQTMAKHLFTTLRTIRSSQMSLERIHAALRRYRVQLLSFLEEDPHDALMSYLIPDILGSISPSAWGARSNLFSILGALEQEPLDFWRSIMDTWVLTDSVVEIKAVPSTARAKEIEQVKAKRHAHIKRQLGRKGLQRCRDHVARALNMNKVRPEAFQHLLPPIADPQSIARLPYTDAVVEFADSFPCGHQIAVETSFHHVKLVFDLRALPSDLVSYLVLFQEALFQLPVQSPMDSNAVPVPWTTVVEQLDEHTLTHSASAGLGNEVFTASYLSELFFVCFSSLPDEFPAAIDWVVRALVHPVWSDTARLRTLAKNLLGDIKEWKRDGNTVTGALVNVLVGCATGLPDAAMSIFHQERVLKAVVRDLVADPDRVVGKLQAIHQHVLARPYLVQVGGAPTYRAEELMEQVRTAFAEAWDQLRVEPETEQVDRLTTLYPFPRVPYSLKDTPSVTVVPIKGVTTSFLSLFTDCNLLDPPRNPQYHAVILLSELLSRSEGPIYERIRGPGFAYDSALSCALWTGTLSFDCSESADPAACLDAFHTVLATPLDDLVTADALDMAKCAVTYRHAASRASCAGVVAESLRARLKGFASLADEDEFAQSVWALSVEDVRNAMSVVQRLADPQRRSAVIVCPAGGVDVMQAAVKRALSVEEVRVVESAQLADEFVGHLAGCF